MAPPIGPGLAGLRTTVGGAPGADPGVMVGVEARVDGEAVLAGAPVEPGRGGRTVLGAPIAVDVLVVVDVPVPTVAAAPGTAARVAPAGPGLAGMPAPIGRAPGADPGVMVRVGAPVDDEAMLPGAPVGQERVGRLVFDGFAVAAGPALDAGAMEDEGAATADVDPGCTGWIALDGVMTVAGR